MALSIQYTKDSGETFEQQVGLSVADYTIQGFVANEFLAYKDSKDNVYILCGNSGVSSAIHLGILKIDKNGTKTKVILNWDYSGFGIGGGYTTMQINRSETTATITATRSQGGNEGCVYWSIPLDFTDGQLITEPLGNNTASSKFAIYQDRYIWVASGTTVKIYDYTNKVSLDPDGETIDNVAKAICLCGNDLYLVESYIPYNLQDRIYKFTFNDVDKITKTIIYSAQKDVLFYTKQMLIDRFGDLIILTNSGTASTLLKYTTAGMQIGTEPLNLNGAFYNLNTDKDGNYYYSNALGTYKITANTDQGQAFTGVGTKIRGSGMTTYGNNITNYNPAVFGTQE